MPSDVTLQYGKAASNILLTMLLVSFVSTIHFPFFLLFYIGLSPCCFYSLRTPERGLMTHEGIEKNFKTKLLEFHVPPDSQYL